MASPNWRDRNEHDTGDCRHFDALGPLLILLCGALALLLIESYGKQQQKKGPFT